ncbi:hypothetical protein [Pseudorhodoferax sp.]|uniref:hypothetical protein n=1 Tax=Pseudorhodoferax sp. TaxID=1993553 RepID=UPI002DD681C0|nr:hypothetical protein [Pseudorhodoferax sp.]
MATSPADPARSAIRFMASACAEDVELQVDPSSKLMVDEALRWTYILRSRRRWIGDRRNRDVTERAARKTLRALGCEVRSLPAELLESVLVVRMRYAREELDWAARVLPWEYVLTAATRARRVQLTHGGDGKPSPLTVMRELEPLRPHRLGPHTAAVFDQGLRAMVVVCLPTELRQRWSLDEEIERLRAVLMRRSVPGKETVFHVLDYPTLEGLRAAIADFQPQLVHFAGLDSHLGLRELRENFGTTAQVDVGPIPMGAAAEQGRPDAVHLRLVDDVIASPLMMVDGVLLRSGSAVQGDGDDSGADDEPQGGDGYPRLVGAFELAQRLSITGHRIFLVSFNLWNTAARVAPLLVGEGAALAAVGFQDAFDDALAEFVHSTLYDELLGCGWDLPQAFERTWELVRKLPHVDATGFTLWAGAPLLRSGAPAPRATPEPRPGNMPDVRWRISPHTELNYAVVHNARPLFERFVLETDRPGPDVLVDVDVTVHMGTETASYRRRVEVLHHHEALTYQIHVPLTAELAREARETVHSILHVELRRVRRTADGGETRSLLYCNSHRLRLLPVDQWRDNQRDGRWLPSFVQPRDPAVTQALALAQHYNRVLRDDPSAGFDGYQRADVADQQTLCGVDDQVRAIWATLLHDWQLGYINPPPTYSGALDSQRLRMPSTVRADRAGTCLDLALLFAACLELIDVYPVIFLLKGHALPGWWRHASYREEYFRMPEQNFSGVVDASEKYNTAANAQSEPWLTGAASWREVQRWICEGKLVPIETVRLTEHCGFVEAIEAGVAALAVQRDYDAMVDIVTARAHGVTPLPLLKGGA